MTLEIKKSSKALPLDETVFKRQKIQPNYFQQAMFYNQF